MDRKKVKCLIRKYLTVAGHRYGKVFDHGVGLQFTDITGKLNVYRLNKSIRGHAKAEILGDSICILEKGE